MADERSTTEAAPRSTQATTAPEKRPTSASLALVAARRPEVTHRGGLAAAIPRRPRVTWWLGLILAIAFGLVVLPSITADRWLLSRPMTTEPAPITVRVAPFAGTAAVKGGGILVARGGTLSSDEAETANKILAERPHGVAPYALYFLLVVALGLLCTHHLRRSTRGRLIRVQVVTLALIALFAVAVKVLLLATTVSILVVPVAALALIPTLTLDRIVGLATGVLAALVFAFVGPFDVGVAILLLVQASVAGLVVAEGPKHRTRHALWAGACATSCTALTYPLFIYLALGRSPWTELAEPLHSPWVAAVIGPALGTMLAIMLAPLYQLLVGEITQHQLIDLEDLSHPLLKQIAEKSPGTWQHSLMMANLAEIAANAIGASGRLVRVGAYYHDLGKSLQPKYFIENLEPGETSPHDQLPPEVSCDAIFAHVTEGIVAARRAGLHERIVDFMHMHHGNGVLEYFWAKTREQGNPNGFTIEHFRYPGHPPQSRETAILAICDAVEAASRTLKKADPAAIDSLVQRIVYGKLHLGQLDESGLSMSDLRRVADSLRETIRHANHGRIEYPWQKAEQSASATPAPATTTDPRLDSLDRSGSVTPVQRPPIEPDRDSGALPGKPAPASPGVTTAEALAATAPVTRKPPTEPPQPQAVGSEQEREGRARAEIERTALQRPPAAVPQARPENAPGGTRSGMAVRKVEDRVTTSFDRKSSGGLERALERATVPFERGKSGALEPLDRGDHATAPFERKKTGGLTAIDREGQAEGVVELDGMPPPPPPETIQPASASSEASLDEPIEPPPPTRPRRSSTDDAPIEPIELRPAARKRAATLPPMQTRRAPTVPPPTASARRSPSVPPVEQILGPSGPPAAGASDRPERARTNPPLARIAARADHNESDSELRITAEQRATDFDGVTDPGMPAMFADVTRPRVVLPLSAPPPSNPEIKVPPPDWAKRLAARIDAEIEGDFGGETPVVAPTRSQLQALISGGSPDITKQQSVHEIQRLRAETEHSDPEILIGGLDSTGRRRIDPTHELSRVDLLPTGPAKPPPRKLVHTEEVDPEDIESAIEVAPPARRPATAIGIAKKKPDA